MSTADFHIVENLVKFNAKWKVGLKKLFNQTFQSVWFVLNFINDIWLKIFESLNYFLKSIEGSNSRLPSNS